MPELVTGSCIPVMPSWGAPSKQSAVVLTLQFADLLFDNFQLNCHFMHRFQAITHRFRILQVGQGRVDFHELKRDGLAGVADLLNGFGSSHGNGERNAVFSLNRLFYSLFRFKHCKLSLTETSRHLLSTHFFRKRAGVYCRWMLSLLTLCPGFVVERGGDSSRVAAG